MAFDDYAARAEELLVAVSPDGFDDAKHAFTNGEIEEKDDFVKHPNLKQPEDKQVTFVKRVSLAERRSGKTEHFNLEIENGKEKGPHHYNGYYGYKEYLISRATTTSQETSPSSDKDLFSPVDFSIIDLSQDDATLKYSYLQVSPPFQMESSNSHHYFYPSPLPPFPMEQSFPLVRFPDQN